MIFGVVITKNRNEVVSNKKLNAKYKKFLEGRDIERYGINFSGKFLLYDRTRLHRPRRPEIFEAEEKILVQRISGGKRPLKATLDNQQYYNKESINNIILQDRRFHINYILALLNSSLINWYYSMKFTNASELTVNVSKAYLSQLPIKSIPPAQQEPIILLVDKMLSLKIRLSEMKGKLIDDARKLLEEINEVDSKIDNLIYKLYGMTEEERRVIENSLK